MKEYNKIQERVYDSETLEVRALEENDEKIIEGYALTYNTRSKLLYNSFYEVIEKGAFDNVLRSDDLDVIFNFNHNNDNVMARTKNDTLKLNSDEKGLFFRAILPNTTVANDLYELVKRGDISENSFAFLPAKDGYRIEPLDEGEDDVELITITEVERLRDVSAVTFPAYPETELQARDDDEETTEEVKEEIESDENIKENKLNYKLLSLS